MQTTVPDRGESVLTGWMCYELAVVSEHSQFEWRHMTAVVDHLMDHQQRHMTSVVDHLMDHQQRHMTAIVDHLMDHKQCRTVLVGRVALAQSVTRQLLIETTTKTNVAIANRSRISCAYKVTTVLK